MRRSTSGCWQIWPVGEAATEAVKLQTSKGRVRTFGAQYVRKHRPAWVGRELRAWLVGTETEVKFTAA